MPTFRDDSGSITQVKVRPVNSRKPSPFLTIGGILVGLGIIAALPFLLNLALNVVTLGALGVMGLAFIRLWPAITLGLAQMGMKAEEAVVRMSPLETLELEKQRVRQEVLNASAKVDQAAGALEAMRRRFEENKSRFSPEKLTSWDTKIKARDEGLVMVKDALGVMRDKYRQVEQIVEEAKADLAMAEADTSMAKALGDASADPTSSRRFDMALDQIKRVTGSAESSFETAMRSYQESASLEDDA